MAILDRAQRKRIAKPWVRKVIKELGESKTLTVTDLEAAIQYTEDWVLANQTSYLSGLPQPFKAETNGAAKTLLFAFTILKDLNN